MTNNDLRIHSDFTASHLICDESNLALSRNAFVFTAGVKSVTGIEVPLSAVSFGKADFVEP